MGFVLYFITIIVWFFTISRYFITWIYYDSVPRAELKRVDRCLTFFHFVFLALSEELDYYLPCAINITLVSLSLLKIELLADQFAARQRSCWAPRNPRSKTRWSSWWLLMVSMHFNYCVRLGLMSAALPHNITSQSEFLNFHFEWLHHPVT